MNNNLYDILEIKREDKLKTEKFNLNKELKILIKGFGICIALNIVLFITLANIFSGWDGLWAIIAPCFFTALYVLIVLFIRAYLCLIKKHWLAFYVYTIILILHISIIIKLIGPR